MTLCLRSAVTPRTGARRLCMTMAFCAWTLICAGAAQGTEHVTLRRHGKLLHVDGRLIVTAQDGGILLLARDGVLWNGARQMRTTQLRTVSLPTE
jgi:hypothetical protein